MNLISRVRRAAGAAAGALLLACGHDATAPQVVTPPPVLLKDMVLSNLPSPYYHFEYDAAGRVSLASFASDLTKYNVKYQDNGRLDEMQNTAGNSDRLDYVYDSDGRVALVKYLDASGQIYTVVFFTYDGAKLIGLERDKRVTGGFIIDKTVHFTYQADGNLLEMTTHRPPIEGYQTDATYVTRFEQYDTKVNVDGFSLIHDDFFDHLLLLPGVVFQKGNPAREIRTGDGINYTADYTYTYDVRNRPTAKVGAVTVTNGSSPGVFATRSDFTYYP